MKTGRKDEHVELVQGAITRDDAARLDPLDLIMMISVNVFCVAHRATIIVKDFRLSRDSAVFFKECF